MGGLILLGLVAIAFALVLRFGRLPRRALELVAATLLIAVAGYYWQGEPNERGQSAKAGATRGVFNPGLIEFRRVLNGENFGFDSQWLDYADTLKRLGATQMAVLAVRSGITKNPRSPPLWAGLGDALVAHNKGLLSPAAIFAFEHAIALSPQHPGPRFFYGLSLAENGRIADARAQWQTLLAAAPADARYRPVILRSLANLDAIEAGKRQTPAS